jgi:hypothetical protein
MSPIGRCVPAVCRIGRTQAEEDGQSLRLAAEQSLAGANGEGLRRPKKILRSMTVFPCRLHNAKCKQRWNPRDRHPRRHSRGQKGSSGNKAPTTVFQVQSEEQ